MHISSHAKTTTFHDGSIKTAPLASAHCSYRGKVVSTRETVALAREMDIYLSQAEAYCLTREYQYNV